MLVDENLPPSLAARVSTSPPDARPPAVRRRCTAQGELSVPLCHPHPTKSSETVLKRLKKKCSLEAGKFFVGAQLYFGARSASASIAASSASMGAHGASPAWLRGEEMPQGWHICCSCTQRSSMHYLMFDCSKEDLPDSLEDGLPPPTNFSQLAV